MSFRQNRNRAFADGKIISDRIKQMKMRFQKIPLIIAQEDAYNTSTAAIKEMFCNRADVSIRLPCALLRKKRREYHEG